MNEWTEQAKLSPAFSLARWPIIGWIVLASSGTIILQSISSLQPIKGMFFGGLILLHISLLWHVDQLTKRRPWFYFFIQALLVHGSALLVPNGAPVELIALNPVLIGQSIALVHKKSYLFLTFLFYYAMFGVTAAHTNGPHELWLFIPLYLLMTVVVGALSNLAIRQIQAQHQTQTFLSELTVAHQRVEELTVANERQRMARDLHDTLAQGLVGLIMQLEAVDAHLSMNNPSRAQAIVLQTMERARRTLAEARLVIDNLRALSVSNYDFAQAVHEEVERYQQETGLHVHLDLKPQIGLSKLVTEHALHIVKECLANVAAHAEADQVWIMADQSDAGLRLEIRDDGRGFNTSRIGKKAGHYGLLGIQERVHIIGGTYEIKSDANGTVIRVDAPLQRGEEYEI